MKQFLTTRFWGGGLENVRIPAAIAGNEDNFLKNPE